MMKLINYFEKIEQHYNIKSDFLVHSSENIFNSIDELFIFVKSFDYINKVLKDHKVDGIINIEMHDTINDEYNQLFKKFINKEININELKQKIADYYSKSEEIKEIIEEINNYKKTINPDKFKLNYLHEKLFRTLYPKRVGLILKFRDKMVDYTSGFPMMNFRSFFNNYHDMLFHLLSDPNVVNKFKSDEYGDFSNPYGFTPQEILKELFSLQTGAIAPNTSYDVKFGQLDNQYDFFKELKISFNNRNIPLKWKNFREVFKDYPKIIGLFKVKDFPDDDYFINPDNNEKNIRVTPGNVKKIMKHHAISSSTFQGNNDAIKNFEGEIAFVLKQIGELVNKFKKKDNSKYIKQIFKDDNFIKLFN